MELGSRTRAALAWALWLVSFGCCAAGLLALRRPENPIGWLYGAAGLAWAYTIPVEPLIHQSIREHRPLPLAAQLVSGSPARRARSPERPRSSASCCTG